MGGSSPASKAQEVKLAKVRGIFLLQTVEKENLQRNTEPGKVVELDQKPDLELTTGLQSH